MNTLQWFSWLFKGLKWLLLAIFSFFVFVVFADMIYPVNLDKSSDTSREVLDSSKKWLYVTTNSSQKWRFKPNLDKLDPLYIKMLLNFEDKHFYTHYGVNPLALFRAVFLLLKNGHITSGGSTITMQLARLLEPKSRTLGSKIVEIIRAIQLEIHYSKKEILQTYLTLAPYGGNIEGVKAASWHFFGKLPYSLSASQCAMLVALPKNPEAYRPDHNPIRAKKARDRVLKQAFEKGIISRFIYRKALQEAIEDEYHFFPRYAAHLSQKLLNNKHKKLINTTIDATLQKQLEEWAKLRAEELPKGSSMALLLVQNSTSEVKTYIGSNNMFSKKFPGFIDMVTVVRSPGSALKPFIYAMGFQKHIIHPKTVILDKEVSFGNYHPHNYNRKFKGQVSITEALQNSLNIPAVKVLFRVGAGEFIENLNKICGKVIVPKGVATLPVALGGLGISLWQLTQGYVSLANGGKVKSLRVIETSVKNNNKKNINVFDEQSIHMVTAILRDIPPPKNFINRANKIAYKTGTSYGYRDFWSMGYTKNYTIGIWVGRADNRPVIKTSARQIATPLMFEAFSMVDAIKGLKEWNWSVKSVNHAPPEVLKYFDKELKNKNTLKFLYPKDGAKYQSAGCHKVTVRAAIDNGYAPYFWYIDNKPTQVEKKSIQLPFSVGAHSITVIDNSGTTIQRNIWVNMPDCQEL